LAPAASLVSVHHLRPRAGLDRVCVYLWHDTSMYWHLKTWLESVPVTADLSTIVIHSHVAINA